jgi:ubiquinone/menaquinone biosynthesis C-methylase UbiE
VTSQTYQSDNYSRHTSTNRLYRKHLESFHATLYEAIEKTGCETLLDAGCGEGFVIDYLASRNPSLKLTGIDLDEKAIEYATSHFGERARFRSGSVYKLPFSDSSFDTVLCSEVLEHLDDPNRAVGELQRVARNYVVVTVPHEPYFGWLNRLGQFFGINPDPGHVNFWTSNTFQAFMRVHFKDPQFTRKQLYQIAVAAV